jgi:hypothetical protein
MNATNQVKDFIAALKKDNVKFGMIWFDIEVRRAKCFGRHGY